MVSITVAGIQATPAFLDRDATIGIVIDQVAKAAEAGARVIVFPEAFVPGYPDWVWRTKPFQDGEADWYGRLSKAAIAVPSDGTQRIGEAARQAQAYVVVGVHELADGEHTIYNSLLFFGPSGDLLGKHRKLMPTGGERLVWGMGDGSGLRTYATDYGRLGGLICWENYMPLARAALYGEGIDIYVAPTWDNSDQWVPTLQHIAKEGRCYVIGASPFLRGSDIPGDIPGRDDLYGQDEDLLSRGTTAIVAPDGTILAGPLVGEAGIVLAEIETAAPMAAKQAFDPNGHYARPDVFQLLVNRTARRAVTYVRDDSDASSVTAGDHQPAE